MSRYRLSLHSPLSRTASYALRAVLVLARSPGQALTIRRIADHAHAPLHYLAKILLALSHAGLVGSRRGPRGGFALCRPSDHLTLLDVISAVSPSRRLGPALDPPTADEANPFLRGFHDAWDRMEQVLRSGTVAELAAALPPDQVWPQLPTPPRRRRRPRAAPAPNAPSATQNPAPASGDST